MNFGVVTLIVLVILVITVVAKTAVIVPQQWAFIVERWASTIQL